MAGACDFGRLSSFATWRQGVSRQTAGCDYSAGKWRFLGSSGESEDWLDIPLLVNVISALVALCNCAAYSNYRCVFLTNMFLYLVTQYIRRFFPQVARLRD